jgi:hypothetical protein
MPVRSMVWVLGAGVVALGACGEGERRAQPDPAPVAHPFAVGQVPAHYQLVVAGRGTDQQQWSAEMGADEPYVAVDADGRIVVASIVPWEPMESSLEWASASGDVEPETFVLDDGRPAAYGEGTDGGWDDLVIEVGPTEALRVATEDAPREELVGLADHITTDGDASAAPEVEGEPESWRVLGSVEPDAVMALRAEVHPRSNAVPGPPSGYSVGWLDERPPMSNSGISSLTAMVLPGDAADLEALAVRPPRFGPSTPPSRVEVAGRPALLFDGTAQFGGGLRSIVTNDESGALVVVAAYGEALPSQRELVAIAGSVRPIDEAEWTQFEIDTFGGSSLVADRGETELARGKEGDVEWLLQTSTHQVPSGAMGPNGDGTLGPLGPTSVQVDECLKLSIRQRACPLPSGGGSDGSVYLWTSSAPDFDGLGLSEFVMITTSRADARRMRVTVGGEVAEADVHPVPDGAVDNAGAGVVFIDIPDQMTLPICNPSPPPAPDGMELARVELLDGAGRPIGCVGM